MGGVAVVVDWERRVDDDGALSMLAFTPHRTAGGTTHAIFDHAALAETDPQEPLQQGPGVTTLGHFSIVGDLRLWNRDGLRSRAGGHTATVGMTDRRLLLEAYRRTGIGFLSDVDGDYAFVMWDHEERRVIAVRDRFGTKPLFFEATPTGIRFASEPKQLAATSARPVRPCARSIAEYLDDHYTETRYSFFDGIHRVRPAMALIADPIRRQEIRYWSPEPDRSKPIPAMDVATGLRERLADAVRRRVETSVSTVSHLTGGLDSSSITAAAHLLESRGQLPSPFHTVSAVFPGHAADESAWIDAIVSGQPFPHHGFEPRIDGIEAFDQDMWDADQPRVHRIRGIWTETASIATAVGADLVLTGFGGDQILDQDQLTIDRLRTGPISHRLRDARTVASAAPRYFLRLATEGTLDALPPSLRKVLRLVVRRRHPLHNPLANTELLRRLDDEPVERAPIEFGFPAPSQNYVVAFAQHPTISWFNEIQEVEYASRGLAVSHPFLDRSVVEYVASIPIRDRPLDGRTKTLVRNGFAGLLPATVLDRRTKAIADEYLDRLFMKQGVEYRIRYPRVTDDALEYLNADRYAGMMAASASGRPGYTVRESLWNAWTLMAWLDVLRRH